MVFELAYTGKKMKNSKKIVDIIIFGYGLLKI